ncbi:hypothetical protein ABI_22400 [Asticcacaulis biprosthecium C19]|uniref:Uncharacterized protein n=1 Tax=Asticcacaulis biprosthecium C19 TaxID=715226 RepID=F4QNC1_9CAUL|nr:hypothetical protein ABI_22400 [Asticcacaulis biprosthecium C19]
MIMPTTVAASRRRVMSKSSGVMSDDCQDTDKRSRSNGWS